MIQTTSSTGFVPTNVANNARIEKALRRILPDRVPFDFSMAGQSYFLSGWLGVKLREFALNPQIQLDAEIAFRNRFQGSGVLGPNIGPGIDIPSALGAQVHFPEDNPAWVLPLIHSEEDLKEYLASYTEPDVCFSGYIPMYYAQYYYMYQKIGDQLPAPYGVLGPIEAAAMLLGTNFFVFAKLYPELIHKLLDKITDFIIHYTEKKIDIVKREMTSMFIAEDSPGNFSPTDFASFVIPYTGRIFKYFGQEINFWHCDLKLKHVARLLPEMGVTVLIGFDPNTDVRFFKETIGDKICFIGNVHPLKMLYGTVEEVRQHCIEVIKGGKPGGGFILAPGGELGSGTPPENIDVLIEVAEEYGSY